MEDRTPRDSGCNPSSVPANTRVGCRIAVMLKQIFENVDQDCRCHGMRTHTAIINLSHLAACVRHVARRRRTRGRWQQPAWKPISSAICTPGLPWTSAPCIASQHSPDNELRLSPGHRRDSHQVAARRSRPHSLNELCFLEGRDSTLPVSGSSPEVMRAAFSCRQRAYKELYQWLSRRIYTRRCKKRQRAHRHPRHASPPSERRLTVDRERNKSRSRQKAAPRRPGPRAARLSHSDREDAARQNQTRRKP